MGAPIRLSQAERESLELLSRAQLGNGPSPGLSPVERTAWLSGQVELWRDLLNEGRPLGLQLWWAVREYLVSEGGDWWPRPATLAARMVPLPSVSCCLAAELQAGRVELDARGAVGRLEEWERVMWARGVLMERAGRSADLVEGALWWEARDRTLPGSARQLPAVLDRWLSAAAPGTELQALLEARGRFDVAELEESRELSVVAQRAGVGGDGWRRLVEWQEGRAERERSMVEQALGPARARGAA